MPRFIGGKAVWLPCQGWRCDTCRPKRRAELSKRAQVGFTAALEERAHLADVCEYGIHEWTITFQADHLPGELRSPEQMYEAKRRLDHIKRASNESRRREGLPPLIYLKVVEYTARGVPHFHFVVIGNPWPVTVPHRTRNDLDPEEPRDRALLKERGKWLQKFGAGFVHTWSPVRDVRAIARYLTDYITKTAQEKLPRYCPRYSTSRGLAPALKDWRVVRGSFPALLNVKGKRPDPYGQPWEVGSVSCAGACVDLEGRYWLQPGWKVYVEHLRRERASRRHWERESPPVNEPIPY